MSKSLRKVFGAVAAVLLFPACKPGVPSDLIQPAELEDLLYDYHVAQAMAETGGDSMNFKRYSYVQAVFEKHGVSEAEFDSTMVWYASHATYLNDIYKKLQERYSTHVSALGASTGENDIFAHLDARGDTANIWQERAFRILKPSFMEDRLLFTMTADTTFRKGDALLWRFDARYISHGRQNEAYAGFYVKYDNDSTAGITQRIYSNNLMQLRLEGDTAHAIREVGGFVYYKPSDEDKESRLLLLRDIMLVRFHLQPVVVDTAAAVAKPDSMDASLKDSVLRVIPADTVSRRLSPTELRDSRPVERSIHVVKEKPYRVIRKPGATGTGRRGH